MGLGNWLLKNGPGSPGSTAKSILKAYTQLINEQNASPEQAWAAIVHGRHEVNLRIRNKTAMYPYFEPRLIYHYCDGDLALFTFIILYIETQQFREGVSMGTAGFDSTLEVIKETIHEKAPDLIKLSSIDYRHYALKFMNDIFISETNKDY